MQHERPGARGAESTHQGSKLMACSQTVLWRRGTAAVGETPCADRGASAPPRRLEGLRIRAEGSTVVLPRGLLEQSFTDPADEGVALPGSRFSTQKVSQPGVQLSGADPWRGQEPTGYSASPLWARTTYSRLVRGTPLGDGRCSAAPARVRESQRASSWRPSARRP